MPVWKMHACCWCKKIFWLIPAFELAFRKNWKRWNIKPHYWNANVVILIKFSSLIALEVVKMTTSNAASDENFVKMMTILFSVMWAGTLGHSVLSINLHLHLHPYLHHHLHLHLHPSPDNKIHGTNMGPTWVLSASDGPHVGPWTLLSGSISLCVVQ